MKKLSIVVPSKRQINPAFCEEFARLYTPDAMMTDGTNAIIDILKVCPFLQWPDETDWELEVIHVMALTMLMTRSPYGMCIHWDNIPDSFHIGDFSIPDLIFGDQPDEDTLTRLVEILWHE